MVLFQQLTGVKSRVKSILKTWPHLRDDDFKLIATFWKFEAEAKKKDLNNINAMEFLKQISKGAYTHSESIRRCRAKIQEQEPSLRGKNYKRRKDDGENFTKNINDL